MSGMKTEPTSFHLIDYGMLGPHFIGDGECPSTRSVTQVLELREKLERSQLPLNWVKVVEVVHRDWIFKPAVSKHRAALERLRRTEDRFDVFKPYIARPNHLQDPHTGQDIQYTTVQGHVPIILCSTPSPLIHPQLSTLHQMV